MADSRSLQDGIDEAGSAVALLWQPGAGPWTPEVVAPEYAGWRIEQAAWHESVALMDLSHHMSDTTFDGPDARRLLSDVSANDYERFAVGQAKQFVPVAADGNIIADGILLRADEDRYVLTGGARAQNWVKYHAERGGYDVDYQTDPNSNARGGADPRLFRYQVQGPRAGALVERAFGGSLPETRFFHSALVELAGRPLRALRHGMAGQAGYELIGDWEHADAVKDALLAAGDEFGLVQVGALAYPTASLESGWVPQPVPAIYTDPDLADYRAWLPLQSFEGRNALHGSYFSERIEDYYVSPWELGYGRSITFDHDFIGRDALAAARDQIHRRKVTLVLDVDDVRRELGDDFQLSYARQRVEADGRLLGMTHYAGSVAPVGTMLALALLEESHAEPGTAVEIVWGEHPGPGTAADADLGHPRLRATVYPAPYDPHARTTYRRDR